MTDTTDNTSPNALPPPERRRRVSARAIGIGGAIAVLIAGAALGAGGTRLAQNWGPQRVLLLQPAAIGDMRDDTPVAVKGEVTEIFGNKFILQDSSGRALVDTGPRGEDRRIVSKGEALTVQGRFDGGIIRAQLIAHADGRNEAFGPPGPKGGPKDGPKGPKAPKDGPRADRDGPPPPAPARERADRGPPPPPADRINPEGDAPPPPPR